MGDTQYQPLNACIQRL